MRQHVQTNHCSTFALARTFVSVSASANPLETFFGKSVRILSNGNVSTQSSVEGPVFPQSVRREVLNTQPIEHDDFLRLLLKSEREILRYVMVLVPQAADAQEVFQETAVALWKQIDKYDPAQPFTP